MNKNYLYLSILAIGLIACGESHEENSELTFPIEKTINADSVILETVVEEINEDEIAFIKFDDYATILSKNDLIEIFGKENLVDKTTWFAEGTIERQTTTLTNPNNGHVIKYIWAEEDNSTTSWIESNYYLWDESFEIHGEQMIESKNGLKLGMSLADLKDWNNADIRFSGFGWDYAGNVFVDEGTKLAESNIQITLLDNQGKQDEKWLFLIGDIEFSTVDEKLKDAPILVEKFTIYIETK